MPATPASDYDPDRPARSPRNAQRGLLRCDVRALSDIDVAKAVFDAVRARDLDALLRVYSDDIVIRDDPRLPYGGEYQGRDGAIQHAAGFAGTRDPHQSPGDRDPAEVLLDAGTQIVAVWQLRASHRHQRLDQTTVSLLN
ncbi:MAG TPA: nuclear transport factor 2 family protein, partial [Streptosporangiaceae bacterium]